MAEPMPRGSWFSILLAVAAGVLVCAALFVLAGGVLGPMLAVPLIAAAVVFGLGALHYLVWGWWLSRHIHRQVEQDEQREKSR